MKKTTAKRLLCLLLAFPLVLPSAGCAKKAPEPAPREYNEQGYRVLPFSHGLNVNVMCYPYFPVTPLYWKMLKTKTYEDIADAGFDHLRLSVDFRYLYNKEKNTLNPYLMKRVDTMLDKAEAQGLYVFLLSSGWGEINTEKNPEKAEEFEAIWRLLAERYRDRSDYLCFELLNEPNTQNGGNLDAAHLNPLQNKVIAAIRETNPDRLILATGPEWSCSWALKDVRLPSNDPNIALVGHCYEPLSFTHQGATWGDPNNNYRVPLESSMLKSARQQLYAFKEFTDKTGVQVVMNEFGVYTTVADPDDITEYLANFTNCCREYGLAWTYFTYWEIGGGFGVWQKGRWLPAIMNGLFPGETGTETKGS